MKKMILPFALLLISITAICQNPLLLKDVYPGITGSGILEIVKTSNYTFFNAEDTDPDADRGLYRTDGTPGGTIKLNLTYPAYASTKADKLTALGSKVIFAGDNFFPAYGEIWASDGTQAGTIALERFQPTINNRGPVFELAAMNGYVYYGVVANNNKMQLRRTDGTAAGTSLVYEFSSFTDAPDPGLFKVINGILYFNIYHRFGAGNDEVWRSDGTAAGTYQLRDMGTEYFLMGYFMEPVNGAICFMTGKFSNNNSVLFTTDGTPAGTVPLYEFTSIYNNNLYPSFTTIGNTLYFSAHDGINGKELWKTDGTLSGTVLVADINPGSGSSNPLNLTTLNNELYFTATTVGEGTEPRKYNGISVSLVKDIYPGTGNGYTATAGPVSKLIVSNGTILFSAANDATGSELWITDGTSANTKLVADINPLGASAPSLLTPGNPVYFSANNGVNGVEIFKYDNSGSILDIHSTIYVNDNSTSGDSFTTAVGNNANAGTKAAPVATVTYAISLAQTGDTILVDAGTYVENVIVNKSLVLRGAKYGQHPLASLDRGNETIILPATNNVALTSSVMKTIADNITIDGFMLDGDNPSLSGGTLVNGVDANAGAGVFNDNLYINNLTVINTIVKNTAGYGIGQAKNATAPAATGALFRYNRVDNVQTRGIVLNLNSYGSIMDNHITRSNNNGIWIANHTQANPSGLPVVISGNIASATTLGIQVSVVNGAAPLVEILSNDITVGSSGYGISIVSGPTGNTTGVTAANNNVTGGISSVLTNLTTALSPVIFSNNSFTGYSSKSFETYNGVLITATCNWHGTAVSALIQSNVLGNVNYTPWLINGTDSDPAVGFQPVANACVGQPKYYVNDNSITGDVFTTAVGSNANNGSPSSPFATPDYAYSIAQPGDTIYLDAGTYDLGGLTYSFPKAVVLLGTNYQVSPNDPANKLLLNTARNTESILTNGKMTIASNGISVEGFTFDVGNRTGVELVNTAPTNNDFGNFKFAKNIFKITHTNANLNSFSITGKFVTSPALPVTSGYTINDNRFEKSGSATGTTFNFNYVKNISIADNSFVVTGSTLRTQQIANLGNTGIVESFNFSNNIAEAAGIVVNSVRVASGITTGNKLINTDRALNVVTSMPESSSIEFSNNIVETTIGGGGFVGYNRTGTSLVGTSNIFIVENNSFTGIAIPAVPLQLFGSMNFTVNNSVLNPSFIIRGNKITYSGDFSVIASEFIRPITVRGNVANLTLEQNELSLNNTGIPPLLSSGSTLPANPGITINTDFGTGAYMPANAIINISNNKVQGFKQSVVFYDGTNAGINAYTGYGNIPVGATVNINNNSFTGDSVSINSGTVGQVVNGTCNWYGSAAAQMVLPKISTATVNYIPWLINGTDNDIATGFQPVTGSCNGTAVTVVVTQSTNVNCNGSNTGSIDVTITGGTAPYTFAWTKDNVADFSAAEDLNGIGAGVYQLTVTDANGSVAVTTNVTITEPPLLTVSVVGVNLNCFGDTNGSATVTATGGTGPYTYLWSNAATTNSISSLTAGNYTVTVTDANGCTALSAYEVTQPAQLTAVAGGTNISCFGGSNGSATVSATGGTGPYTYLWSNAATTNSTSSLTANNYTVTVTDANGCTTQAAYEVTQPAQLTASASGTNVNCFGGSNGTASVSVSGGTTAYTYLWSNAATTNSISSLTAGNYSVVVTDANGCIANANYTVTQPPVLSVVMSGTAASCNGSATATPAGGTSPYTYNWSNGATTQTISPVPNGTYTVVVTDAKGCTVNGTHTITGNSPINPAASVVNVNCFGGSTGSITVTGAGGVAPRTYNINGGTFQASTIFPNLPAGVYVVGARDATGCVDFVSKTITQPTLLTVVLDSVRAACFGTNTGRILITAAGGTGAKTYSWTGPNGYASNTQDPVNLFAGSYNLTVTDTKGCTASLAVNVVGLPQVAITEIIIHVGCRGDFTGAINATITGGSGLGFTYRWNGPGVVNIATEDLTGLRAGNFTLIVTDIENGCALTKVIVVTQPAAVLNLAAVKTNVNGCISMGTITGTASGGTAPYQYSINGTNYQASGLFINIGGGTYTVYARDANGCTDTKALTVTDNGTDQYEGNNTKAQAKVINISTNIFARIALASDAADWFRFTTTAGGGNYILTLTHPSVNYVFNLYAAGTNTPALVPISTTGTTKEYVLAGNTVYYISVTGGLSYTCYSLSVAPPVSFTGPTVVTDMEAVETNTETGMIVKPLPETLSARVYPNPHQGSFKLAIGSPDDGTARIELFSMNGQKLAEKTVPVQKGENNIVSFTGVDHGTIFYRVQVGKYIANGKVIGTN